MVDRQERPGGLRAAHPAVGPSGSVGEACDWPRLGAWVLDAVRCAPWSGGAPIGLVKVVGQEGGVADRDRLGRTAVHCAAVEGDAESLRVLLAGGADAEAADAAG
ncbi:hypothetical protein ACFC63_00760 [Streptomyces albidoflavus]